MATVASRSRPTITNAATASVPAARSTTGRSNCWCEAIYCEVVAGAAGLLVEDWGFDGWGAEGWAGDA